MFAYILGVYSEPEDENKLFARNVLKAVTWKTVVIVESIVLVYLLFNLSVGYFTLLFYFHDVVKTKRSTTTQPART